MRFTLFTKGIFLTMMFAAFFVPAYQVETQGPPDYVVLAPIPGTTKTDCQAQIAPGAITSDVCRTNFKTYLGGMYRATIWAAGILAFLMIVIGGFKYILSQSLGGKEDGSQKIKDALFGLVLALASYVFLNTINPELADIDLNFKNITVKKTKESAQAVYEKAIKDGHDRMTKTKADAQEFEKLAAEYEQQAKNLPTDPNFAGQRTALQQLAKEATDQGRVIRTTNTASENMIQAVNRVNETVGSTAMINEQANHVSNLVGAINGSYREAEITLSALGRDTEIQQLNQQRVAAILQVCNAAHSSASSQIGYCNWALNNQKAKSP